MALPSLLWKLASPYDAYIAHVSILNDAIDRVRYMSEMAMRYDAGLAGSSGRVSGGSDSREVRIRLFRERLGAAAASMSDDQFEDFLSHLGGGGAADADADRARIESRRGSTQRGLEEYFGIAGRELALLEARGYNPDRSDIARALRENHLKPMTTAEYRRELHDLAAKVGLQAAAVPASK